MYDSHICVQMINLINYHLYEGQTFSCVLLLLFKIMKCSISPARPKEQHFQFVLKTFKRRTRFVLSQHWLRSLVGLSSQIKQTHIKAAQMFKTELALCIFCLPLREPGPQRGSAARWTWAGPQQLRAPVRSAIPHTSTANETAIYDSWRGGRQKEERGRGRQRGGMRQIYRGAKTGRPKWDVEKKARRKGGRKLNIQRREKKGTEW